MNGVWLQVVTLHSLLLTVSGGCGNTLYATNANGREICCNYCNAGEEIVKVCSSYNSASTCRKCSAGHYNPPNYKDGCKRCNICNAAEGSIQEKPCTISSNAVCVCPEGSYPKNEKNTACLCESGKEIINKKCQPCAYGHFSSRENSKCRPWTNCSATGLTMLVPGSAKQDVQCSMPKSTTAWVLPTSTPTSPSHRERISENNTTSTMESSVTYTKHSTPRNIMSTMNWDTVTLILITVTLLMAMAGMILAVIIQTKKRKGNRAFIRSKRCKVPVQEESTDSNSSLTKNSPA